MQYNWYLPSFGGSNQLRRLYEEGVPIDAWFTASTFGRMSRPLTVLFIVATLGLEWTHLGPYVAAKRSITNRTSNMMKTAKALRRLGACKEAIEWASSYPSHAAAWNACERADWLLWVASKVGVQHELVVRAAYGVASTTLRYSTDKRSSLCLDAVKRWLDGVIEVSDVRKVCASVHEELVSGCVYDYDMESAYYTACMLVEPASVAALNADNAAYCAYLAIKYAVRATDDFTCDAIMREHASITKSIIPFSDVQRCLAAL